MLDSDGRSQFNDLLFGRGDPVCVVFDLLFYEREDIRSLPLKEALWIAEVGPFIGCGKSLYQTVCDMDLEGVICERLEDHYGPDVRWWKVLNVDYTQKKGRGELFERRYG